MEDRVTEHKSAFGIGVFHFHSLTAQRSEDIIRLHGVAADHVFCQHDSRDDMGRQFHFNDALDHADDIGCAAQVILHARHAGLAFDRVAAESYVMPLPTSATGLMSCASGWRYCTVRRRGLFSDALPTAVIRSEERRVGKEWRS